MKRSSMKGTVVVITGASSGIGRATARQFARHGASLVLAARRETMLQEAARECERLGGIAVACPTDMTREEEVELLAQTALERFGKIDVWFNNAGVGVFGRFNSIPSDAWRRVLETNVLGTMHGARYAVQQFREQGHGVLINNASVVGRLAKPDSTAYATSKFAIRGLSESLRQELLDQPAIHVCTILPSVIDTPFFQHAANFSHQQVRAPAPVYTADKVARTVLSLVRHPKAEVVIGGAGKLGVLFKTLMPRAMTRISGRALHAGFLRPEHSPATAGNLFEPMDDGQAVSGGWRTGMKKSGLPLAGLALVGLGVAWAVLGGRAGSLRR